MLLLRRDTKGQVLILMALMMVVLLAVAALALDVGLAYGVKAKLSAAVDAAAIAALRERTSGTGTDSSAATVAANFLNANFPSDQIGIPQPDCTVNVAPQNGSFVASVTATTVVPTVFARILGWRGLTVTARSEATRSDLDVAMVLDSTESLKDVFPTVQMQSTAFASRFSETNDRLALVPFATGVSVVDSKGELVLTEGVEINKSSRGFNRATVNAAISNLQIPAYPTYTASEFGIRMGLYELNKVNSPSAHRAIVFFSDGAPNTFTGNFPIDAFGNTMSGNLFSGTTNPDPPSKLYHPNVRNESAPQYVGLYKVPATGGGNFIGSVQILPELPVTNKQRNIGFYDSKSPLDLKCDANKAARNMLENLANHARSQGISIYAIGFGTRLDQPDISSECSTSTEAGSMIMKRISNTRDSDTYNPGQPTGIFCRAVKTEELGACFDTIADALLRLTR